MKPILDPRGQWAHPGKVTKIPSNNITMKGVPYPVLGISNTGDKKLMMPGKNYKFKGKYVTEYPWLKKYQAGGEVNPSQQVYDKQKQLLTGLGLPMPTAADSLALYNNSLDLQNYYFKKQKYRVDNTDSSYSPALNISASPSLTDINYELFKVVGEENIKDTKAYYDYSSSYAKNPEANSTWKVGVPSGAFSEPYLPKEAENYSSYLKKLKSATYNTKFTAPYKFQTQDSIAAFNDPYAPVQKKDFRIAPSNSYRISKGANMTIIDYYDPKHVKPWSMRTTAEKEYHRNRMKMFANSMTGSSTPSTPYTPPKPKTFGEVSRLPEKGIDINKTVAPNLKKPINNKVTGIMPSFMIPSTGSSVKGDRDLYEWDYELKKYIPTKIVSPDEGRNVYDAIFKSSLDSLNSELNNSSLGNKKRNPFVKSKGGWLNKYNI